MVAILTFVLAAAVEAPLKARSSPEATPCVVAAVAAYGRPVSVATGPLRDTAPADVLVGSSVEITRALEGGDAVVGSEEPLARIPWVLSVATAGAGKPGGLADLGRGDLEVLVLGGPAAYEARRALAAHAPGKVRESRDVASLRRAPLALVPVSLAGPGERVAVEIPPVAVGAAVAARAARPEAARAFVSFLTSEAGQAAFAACGAPPPTP